jgi:hypothetical protein
VSLTPKGERLLADSLPAWRAAQDRFVQAMGAEYWVNLRSELDRLAQVAVQLESSQRESPSSAAPAD